MPGSELEDAQRAEPASVPVSACSAPSTLGPAAPNGEGPGQARPLGWLQGGQAFSSVCLPTALLVHHVEFPSKELALFRPFLDPLSPLDYKNALLSRKMRGREAIS